jgi:hypothetical protein
MLLLEKLSSLVDLQPQRQEDFLFVAILQGFPLSMRSKVKGEIPAIRASSTLLNILASRIFLTLFG